MNASGTAAADSVAPMTDNTLRACPDCEQGKHSLCLGETWDNDADDYAPCPCAEATPHEVAQ